MALQLERAKLTEMIARAHADLLHRLPTDYPEVYERVMARRLAKQNNTPVVDTQEPTGIKAAILNASFIALLAIISWTIGVAFPGNA